MFDFFKKKDKDKKFIQNLKQNTYAEMQERIRKEISLRIRRIRKEKEQQNVINDPQPLYEIPINDYLEKSIPEIQSDANECGSRMDIIYNYIESYINARKDETDPVKVNGYRQHMGECLAMWNKYKHRYDKLYKMIEIRNINPEFETMRPSDDTVGNIRFGETI